jgi:hypothetical protein
MKERGASIVPSSTLTLRQPAGRGHLVRSCMILSVPWEAAVARAAQPDAGCSPVVIHTPHPNFRPGVVVSNTGPSVFSPPRKHQPQNT